MEVLKANLVSSTKLDRDRALQELESAVGGKETDSSMSEADLKSFIQFVAFQIYFYVSNVFQRSRAEFAGKCS
jgi:hypothetical protein